MKVTFTGNPNDPGDLKDSIDLFGVHFPLNEAVDVEPGPHVDKLRANGHFIVFDEISDTPYSPLDGMSLDNLKEFAAEHGIKIHHKMTDLTKIKAIIEEGMQSDG